MTKLWLVALSLFVLVGCTSSSKDYSFFSSLPDGISLVEQVEAVPGKAMIPYKKYRLDNGMTVILSPDDSDPLVHVDVTYHVGSAREVQGNTGFAHFFEHMMFQGSKHVGDQQHFKYITEAGGELNGTTNRDKTHYFETVPANQLEKVLWLESDRMGFLLDAVSQRKFEIQRDTVKNERAQNYDNRPYGLIWEKMGETLYPRSHPYSWQTIGYVEDLDRVDVNDLKSFFLRWYGPNNATLVIGGDIQIDQTLNWVNKYFGSIPKGPEVDDMPKAPAVINETRFVTIEDRIQQPMVVVGWPTEYLGAETQVPLDVLSQVLGSGANSLLYQKLVKTNEAINAGAFQDCGELACTFYLYAMSSSTAPDALHTLYQQLLDIIQEVKSQGVNEERFEEIKGIAQADAIFALESVKGKVSQLAYNDVFFDQPDRLQTNLSLLENVSMSDIDSVLSQFLVDKSHAVLSVVPKGKRDIAVQAVNFIPEERVIQPHKTIALNQLEFRNVEDDFDRSEVPVVGDSLSIKVPELYKHHFSNGITLMGTESLESPSVLFKLKLPAGERYVDEGKEGLAELTASLIGEGSQSRTQEQIQAQLDRLGSSVSISAGHYTTTVTVSALVKNFDQTLAIVDELLFHPRFDPKDLERLKQKMKEGVVYQQQKLTWQASQATRQVLFGDSLFSRISDGTEQSIDSLTLEDVLAFYQQHYTPQGAQIVIVGDVNEGEAISSLDFLGQWQGEYPPLLAPQILPQQSEQKIYVLDHPGATQSIVRFVRTTKPFDATGELYLAQLANFNLAGNFNSRMNQNLREDKGYTYGMDGYLASNREIGIAVFEAPVKAEATGLSIIEMRNEMNHYVQNGLDDDELAFMRLAVGQQDALMYETQDQKADLISGILTYSLHYDYLQQRNEIVATVKKATLNESAKKWFNPNDYQIIVVGDANVVEPQLEKLNLPMVKLEIIR
ncbi:M16 family metallopeptidase [Vibrio sp. RC27]